MKYSEFKIKIDKHIAKKDIVKVEREQFDMIAIKHQLKYPKTQMTDI